MFDAVLNLLHGAVTSDWVYPVLFLCALLDGVLPVLPAETLVVTAGLYAAQGRPSLPLVVLAAAAGATAGDHLTYALGRAWGTRLRRWMARGRRRAAAFGWAERGLAVRGGVVLVAARYVAGGRNATTLTMGMVGYPLRSFTAYDLAGAVSWALFSALSGYVGGVAFTRHPVEGLLFGLCFAVAITLVAEISRQVGERRAERRTARDHAGNAPDPRGPGPGPGASASPSASTSAEPAEPAADSDSDSDHPTVNHPPVGTSADHPRDQHPEPPADPRQGQCGGNGHGSDGGSNEGGTQTAEVMAAGRTSTTNPGGSSGAGGQVHGRPPALSEAGAGEPPTSFESRQLPGVGTQPSAEGGDRPRAGAGESATAQEREPARSAAHDDVGGAVDELREPYPAGGHAA